MPIINKEKWNEYIEVNSKNGYSDCCVKVSERVMEILDEDDAPLHKGYYPDMQTAHGIICKADDDIDAGGITGFMAGAVAQMVKSCHSRGSEFWDSYKTDVIE
jgi:hypothetical protein